MPTLRNPKESLEDYCKRTGIEYPPTKAKKTGVPKRKASRPQPEPEVAEPVPEE
jgi:hypothetical protein